MGIFIISPSDKGGMLYKPPRKLAEACRPFSPIAFHDLWIWNLSDPPVHTLVVGAARPSDFDEHVAGQWVRGKQEEREAQNHVHALRQTDVTWRSTAAKVLVESQERKEVAEQVR